MKLKAVEIWKDVVGYEGLYKVSNEGRIKSLDRFDRMGRPVKEKILKQFTTYQGYKTVVLCKDTEPKTRIVHRLIAIAFLPNPLNLPEVNHKNGVKDCNFCWNLEWVTPQENSSHAYKNGLSISSKGEKQGNSKLKDADVLKIRELYSKGTVTQKTLSIMFNTSTQNISSIVLRKRWTHI